MPGLTKAQAIAYVQQGLSWRTDRTAEITLQFSLTQREELEQGVTLPQFLIKRDAPLAGTANNPVVAVPADFIRNIDTGGVYWLTDGGGRWYLRKRAQDWIIKFMQESAGSGGSPQDWILDATLPQGPANYYAILEGSYYVMPVPDFNFTIYANYYAHDVDFASLGDGAQNLWLTNASGMLCNFTGMRMAEDLQDDAAYQKFQRRFAALQQRRLNETVLTETSDNEFKMGNQESWWN